MATEDDPDSERASNVLGFWRWMKAAKVLPRGAMPQFYLSFSWLQRNARQAQSLSTMHAAEGTWTLPSQGEFSLLDLDADNIKTVEETTKRIQENLHSSRDAGLLNTMMEYYLKTRSPTCLQILSGIHEARAQVNWSATIEFFLRGFVRYPLAYLFLQCALAVCCFLFKGIIWENERMPETCAVPFGHPIATRSYCAKAGKGNHCRNLKIFPQEITYP